MPCLYCEESIPLLRELDGSQFCSEDHRREYASRQATLVTAGGAAPSRDSTELRASPARLADFSSLAIIREEYPELRGAEIPISRYCDLMLMQSRRRSRERSALSTPGASIVPWMPAAVPPDEVHGSSQLNLRGGRIALGVIFLGRVGSTVLFPAGFLTMLPALRQSPAGLLAPPQATIEFQSGRTVLSLRAVGRPASTALLRTGFLIPAPVVQEACPGFLVLPPTAFEFPPGKAVFAQDAPGRPGPTTLLQAGFSIPAPVFQAACSGFLSLPQAAIEFQLGKAVFAQCAAGLPAPSTLLQAGFLIPAPVFQEDCSGFLVLPQAAIEFQRGDIVLAASGEAPIPFDVASTAPPSAGFLTSLLAFREVISGFQTPPLSAIEFPPGTTIPGGVDCVSSTSLLPAGFSIQPHAMPAGSQPSAQPDLAFRPCTGALLLDRNEFLLAKLDFAWDLPQQESEAQDAAPLTADFLIDQHVALCEPVFTSTAWPQLPLGFALEPVWLPALFTVADPAARRRGGPWSNPSQTLLSPARGRGHRPATGGPSFTGLLAWPQRSGVYWEFRETWSPPGVVEEPPEPVRASLPPPASPWGSAIKFWRSAPAVARGFAVVVPLMIPVLFVAPSVGLQMPSLGFSSIAAAARARATVDLEDDFHSGLDGWTGKEGWAKSWSFDGAGSARPGSLALLKESIRLTDYHVELLGQIDSKALGFVLRAADMMNYQAVKLAVTKPGPLPTLALVRYTVIDGREGPKTQTPLTLEARSDTLYKLVVDVQGDHFSVLVNGVYAGSWTEDRLKSGGVGFFADKGEGSRLRWVHLIDKQDFLGWICYQVSQWTADRKTSGVKQ